MDLKVIKSLAYNVLGIPEDCKEEDFTKEQKA